MTRMLIQDDIIDKMDVYVDYTVDGAGTLDAEVILFDYGLELTGRSMGVRGIDGREVLLKTSDTSLRGYCSTEWMRPRLIAYIEHEEGIIDERFQ